MDARLRAPTRSEDVTVLCRARPLARRQRRRHLYTVGTVKRIPGVRTYVAVDGGMSDNLRPMLYGARYEADASPTALGDAAARQRCTIAGNALRVRRRAGRATCRCTTRASGDVLVTPATGAYGYAMANNYNGVPRPPVIFCRDGDARVVVRRETYEDLHACDDRLSRSASACWATAPSAAAFAELLDERADAIEAETGPAARDLRRAHAQPGRLRRRSSSAAT